MPWLRQYWMSDSFTNSLPFINVEGAKRKGQSLTNTIKRLDKQAALSNHQGRSLGPTAGNVGQHQTVHIAAAVSLSAMRDAVHLHASRRRLVPISEGAHRNAAARCRHRAEQFAGIFLGMLDKPAQLFD